VHRTSPARTLATLATLALSVPLAPAVGLAQSPAAVDTLPFRAGQWGAQFSMSGDVFGLGALRFRTRSRAWALDGAFTVRHQERESPGLVSETRETSGFVRARLGQRGYGAVAPRAAGFVGGGVTGA
jgi:hypothetical protein